MLSGNSRVKISVPHKKCGGRVLEWFGAVVRGTPMGSARCVGFSAVASWWCEPPPPPGVLVTWCYTTTFGCVYMDFNKARI